MKNNILQIGTGALPSPAISTDIGNCIIRNVVVAAAPSPAN